MKCKHCYIEPDPKYDSKKKILPHIIINNSSKDITFDMSDGKIREFEIPKAPPDIPIIGKLLYRLWAWWTWRK